MLPPPGRLRIDRGGDWFDGDQPITHPGLLGGLWAGLRRDDAGHFIQTDVRIPVEVEDTPFVVTRVEAHGERLRVHLNDGTSGEVDPATLGLAEGGVPYCVVKGGRFEARLDRAAAWELLQLADPDDGSGRVRLRLGGRTVPVPPRRARP